MSEQEYAVIEPVGIIVVRIRDECSIGLDPFGVYPMTFEASFTTGCIIVKCLPGSLFDECPPAPSIAESSPIQSILVVEDDKVERIAQDADQVACDGSGVGAASVVEDLMVPVGDLAVGLRQIDPGG